MTRRVKLLVSGRVQGVYFRMFTRNKAKQFGIKGYAGNLPDGRVEIVAEADTTSLEKFIRWCHQGPITARVDEVELTELEPEPDATFTSFEIR